MPPGRQAAHRQQRGSGHRPVSDGGDQGRDFETFRTYLAAELPFAIGFLALASSDVVVFACTIQRDGLRAKFEGDIRSICTQGTHVDRIFIFAVENVPTRLRHDLQEWAAPQYKVALEIIDGTAWRSGWPSRNCTGLPRSTCTCPPN